jgi:hypothetical protein
MATKQKKQPKQKQAVSDKERQGLRTWNVRLAVLLVLEAIAIVVLGGTQTVPFTMQFLTTDTLASEVNGHQVLAGATHHLADVRLSWMVAKFLLLFALVYLLSATWFRGHYNNWLEKGVNKMRWLAWGVGGGVMAVTVATLSGITDVSFLFTIWGSVFVAGLLALAASVMGTERRLRKVLILTSLFAAVLPVLAITSTLVGVLMYDGSLPAFVYYIYGSMGLMTLALAVASYLRLRKRGKWANTVYAERMFMVLGFIAASLLAWQIYAGALQP